MRSLTRNLWTGMTVAAGMSIPTVLGVRATAVADSAAAAQALTSDRAKFVGTYALVTTEVKDASGRWIQTPNFNSIGYVTYSDTGHMGECLILTPAPADGSGRVRSC
jgi:hypothetical protein